MVIARTVGSLTESSFQRSRSPSRGLPGGIRAYILLGGRIRQCPLAMETGRPLLELPLEEGKSLLDHWLTQVEDLGFALGNRDLPTRLLLDRDSPAPLQDSLEGERLSIERDPREYRGTAGLLADVCRDYVGNDE